MTNWVTQKSAPNGLLDMRKSSEATAPAAGQEERKEKKWIKTRARLDLKDVRTDPTRQLVRALATLAGRRETDGCPAHS